MITYAQNSEDILLARVFAGKTSGFYVDIGANDPTTFSLTKHFYDLGWRGINVEPGGCFSILANQRPRDINLNAAISTSTGSARFFEFETSALSTLCEDEAARRRTEGLPFIEKVVTTRTLASICEEHAQGAAIDFISIDVEGHEKEVIQSGDWSRFRPVVVVVESTKPNSIEPNHQQWEPLLLGCGYCFAFFDGLNRYYVRSEDKALINILAVPVNVFDAAIPYRDHVEVVRLRSRIEELENRLREVKRQSPVRYYAGRALEICKQKLRRFSTAAV